MSRWYPAHTWRSSAICQGRLLHSESRFVFIRFQGIPHNAKITKKAIETAGFGSKDMGDVHPAHGEHLCLARSRLSCISQRMNLLIIGRSSRVPNDLHVVDGWICEGSFLVAVPSERWDISPHVVAMTLLNRGPWRLASFS